MDLIFSSLRGRLSDRQLMRATRSPLLLPSCPVRPAVDGTVGVLKSAKKNAPEVKRIVVYV